MNGLGLDFVSENLLPFTLRDVRHFHYQVKPLQPMSAELLLQKGTESAAGSGDRPAAA